MPIYEYQCRGCGHIFENWFEHIDQKNIRRKCPKCKKSFTKRLISVSSFRLTGAGFYATDYAKPKGRVREDKDGA